MPSTKTITKKSPKKAAIRKPRAAAKKRVVKKSPAKRAKKMETKEEEMVSALLSQLPPVPQPEPVQEEPKSMDMQPEDPQPIEQQPGQEEAADEVEPVISESLFSVFKSRTSFYMGVITGAALVHVLLFALVAIVTS